MLNAALERLRGLYLTTVREDVWGARKGVPDAEIALPRKKFTNNVDNRTFTRIGW